VSAGLKAICTISAIHFFAWLLAAPLVALHARALGAGPSLIGLVVSVFAIVPLAIGVPAGLAVDRWGARRMVLVGTAAMVAATGLMAASSGVSLLLVSQAVAGGGQLLLILGAQTYVAGLGGPEDRDRNFGAFAFSNALGQLLGPPAGGAVSDLVRATWGQDVLGYRAAFAAATLASVVAWDLARRLPEVGVGPAAPPRSAVKEVGRLLRLPPVVTALVASTLVLFAFGIRRAFYPIYVNGVGLSDFELGLLFSAQSLASMAVRPFLPRAVAALGRPPLLVACLVLAALGWGTIPLWSSFWPLALAAAAAGVAVGFSQPVTMVMVANAAPRHERGLALGLRLTANRLGQVVSPVLFGMVTATAGLALAFYGAGAALLLGAGVVGGLSLLGYGREAARGRAGLTGKSPAG